LRPIRCAQAIQLKTSYFNNGQGGYESIVLSRRARRRVEEVDDSKIEKPTDVLVKITTTNICGSDLHMYEGRTDVEEGKA